jgi:hypothetical protein
MFNVFVDDIDLSRYAKAIKIELSAQQMPIVLVQLIGTVEIPENILAMVTVEKDDPTKTPQPPEPNIA